MNGYKADYIIIAAPTDFDEKINGFNMSIVDQILHEAHHINPYASLVIRSTIPIGYIATMRNVLNTQDLFFAPEFLRETQGLQDSLHPSRLVIGSMEPKAKRFAEMILDSLFEKEVPFLFTNSHEAEAIKLFSNTFLAMRVAFFNELDSFGLCNNLNTQQIIEGVCSDPRIGSFYNNPSFGYGGYCLPKDTRQLLANFENTPQQLIHAIVSSNETRKQVIVDKLCQFKPAVIGVYRLIMKQNANNYKSSSMLDVINKLIAEGITVIVYEPILLDDLAIPLKIISNFKEFKQMADIIITNRWSKHLEDVKAKVYTRDIFEVN